jgi:hypothetical protein
MFKSRDSGLASGSSRRRREDKDGGDKELDNRRSMDGGAQRCRSRSVYSIIRALAASDLTSFDRCQCARTDERWMQVIGLSSVR